MFLILGRTFKEGIKNFVKNGLLSLAAVSVLTISLLVGGILFITSETASQLLKDIESKVNVTIHFKSDVEENDILEVKKELENYSEVDGVEYISKEQALETFKKNNANRPAVMQALEVVEGNPLPASLVVRTHDPSQYETVVEYVAKASFKEDVREINFERHKEIIAKLVKITSEVKKAGMVIAGFFAVVAALLIFNTIRIAIFTHRQEIEIMRLVGASNTYIRLPFIYEGIIYGLSSSVISMTLLFFAVKYGTPYVSKIIPSKDLLSFYYENIGMMFSVQLGVGILLSVFTSIVAIRRYLKI